MPRPPPPARCLKEYVAELMNLSTKRSAHAKVVAQGVRRLTPRSDEDLGGLAGLAARIEPLAAVLFLVVLVSPHLNSSGRVIRNSWLAFAGWLVLWLIARPPVFRNVAIEARRRRAELAAYGAWLVVVALNAGLARGHTGDLHFYTMVTVGMVLFLELSHSASGPRTYDRACLMFTVALGIEAALSLPTLWSEPAIARQLMTPAPLPEVVAFAARTGVGQYALYTGLAIVLPTLLTQGFAWRGWRRTAMLAGSLSFATAVALATFLGAMLLMAGGLLALGSAELFWGQRRRKDAIALVGLCLAGAVAWSMIVRDSDQMLFATEKFQRLTGASWAGSLGSLQAPGDDTGRPALFMASWRTFVEHPWFGIGPVTGRENSDLFINVGGHSSWIDQFAEYGVVGFTPYLVFLGFAARRAARGAWAKRRDPVVVGRLVSIGAFIVGGTYNPVVVIVTMSPLVFFFAFGGSSMDLRTPQRPLQRPPLVNPRLPRSLAARG